MIQIWLGLALVAVGSWLATPPVLLLGLVLVLAESVRQIWVHQGMRGVEYGRRIPPRAVVGDAIPLRITVWNRKALPLAWLRAVDVASAGVVVRAHSLVGDDGDLALRNAWTLAPFERVTRHFHVVAERRGVHSLGPVALQVGDLFAREAAIATLAPVDRWLVRPRAVRVALHERDDQEGGERRARRGFTEDPTRYAGVRPYQAGDPLRSIHWRATARTGTPVSRRFEPGRQREVVVVIDLQTVEGPDWRVSYDDDSVESLCLAAASLVRQLRADGAAVGLAAPAYARAIRPFTFVRPGASNEQVGLCLDALGRLESVPAGPVEQLLTRLLRVIGPATSIVVLSVRDPAPFVPALRRFAAAGHSVQLVALGPNGSAAAERARSGGIDARAGRLDGRWTTATALVIG